MNELFSQVQLDSIWVLAVKLDTWIESTDIFSDMFIRPLLGTFGFIQSSQSVHVRLTEHPQCFIFWIILWFYAILRVFVLYSHYGYSISNEKLNIHQAFETLGLLGALIFVFKHHIS